MTGCIVASRSCALKVDEVYSPPGARDIVFADCVVPHSNRGLLIQSRDEGDMPGNTEAGAVVGPRTVPILMT